MPVSEYRKESVELAKEDAQALNNLAWDLCKFADELESGKDGELYKYKAQEKVKGVLKRIVNYI